MDTGNKPEYLKSYPVFKRSIIDSSNKLDSDISGGAQLWRITSKILFDLIYNGLVSLNDPVLSEFINTVGNRMNILSSDPKFKLEPGDIPYDINIQRLPAPRPRTVTAEQRPQSIPQMPTTNTSLTLSKNIPQPLGLSSNIGSAPTPFKFIINQTPVKSIVSEGNASWSEIIVRYIIDTIYDKYMSPYANLIKAIKYGSPGPIIYSVYEISKILKGQIKTARVTRNYAQNIYDNIVKPSYKGSDILVNKFFKNNKLDVESFSKYIDKDFVDFSSKLNIAYEPQQKLFKSALEQLSKIQEEPNIKPPIETLVRFSTDLIKNKLELIDKFKKENNFLPEQEKAIKQITAKAIAEQRLLTPEEQIKLNNILDLVKLSQVAKKKVSGSVSQLYKKKSKSSNILDV